MLTKAVFPVVMYGCESWTIKKAEHRRIDASKLWCWRRLLRVSPLDCKEIQQVHPKGNQSWIFIGMADAEAETPMLWPPDVKNWLIGKYPDAGNYWRQEEKGTTENEMVGWHHLLDGHEFEQAPGVGDGQERLACCSPWGHKESDTTEQLNWFIEYLIVFSRMFFTTQLPPVRNSLSGCMTVGRDLLLLIHSSQVYLLYQSRAEV